MDFSGQYSTFAGTQPYHHQPFMPIPPLTPSNSHSATSDDFNTSPPEVYDTFQADHHQQQQQQQQQQQEFQNFEYAQAFTAAVGTHQQQQHQQPATSFRPGPPTPPNNHNVFATAAAVAAPAQQPLMRHPSLSDNGSHSQNHGMSMTDDQHGAGGAGRGGSDEDENLTPAQSRRKAQNRAAQRAFRERKEKHVKDLEAKLISLETAQKQASAENERLKRDLQKMSTENEILRATSHMNPQLGMHASISPEPTHTGPLRYNPTDFYSNVLQNHENKTPSHRIVTSDEGERLLAAGAAWDYIINHELFRRGLVDLGDVSERLKNRARCDGQGPVFSEGAILAAMQSSVASGSDDLL